MYTYVYIVYTIYLYTRIYNLVMVNAHDYLDPSPSPWSIINSATTGTRPRPQCGKLRNLGQSYVTD